MSEVRVLVVEDNPSDYLLLQVFLGQSIEPEFESTNAASLQEALEILEEEVFHIILLDLNLSDSRGLPTFETVFEHWSDIPIVILTGLADKELARHAVGRGAQDFLTKGEVSAELLHRVLRYALARQHHIHELADSNKHLLTLNTTLHSILENIADGVIVVDTEGSVVLHNIVSGAFGVDKNMGPHDWLRLYEFSYSEDDTSTIPFEKLPLVLAMNGATVEKSEVFIRNKETKTGAYFSISARPIFDDDGQSQGTVITHQDVTERHAFEKQLIYDATHDALTQLPNRVLFMDRLEQRVIQHRRQPDNHFAVLFLDLDRFKHVNDSWGHTYGDKLLLEVAQRLRKCLRAEDTIARFGGDEFVLLLHHIQKPHDAVLTAERILKTFEKPFLSSNQNIVLTTSIGIALSQTSYASSSDLMRNADIAMYEAKGQGKACHVVFGQDMYRRVVQFVQTEQELRDAIEREEFELHYQPILELKTQHVVGFEALIRWNRPDKKFISPGVFIPLAENTGQIVPIGWWVIREACRQIHDWQTMYPDKNLSVSINLSAQQFSLPNLAADIESVIDQYGLDSSLLRLEITETAIVENPKNAAEILRQLRERHIQVYMDDFGTGYSSLSYLHTFPLDVLKIDRSFVNQLEDGSRHQAIINTIVDLAHALGMKVVAEGVETKEQCELLKQLNISFVQGYYFSKPLSLTQANELLEKTLSPMTPLPILPDPALLS